MTPTQRYEVQHKLSECVGKLEDLDFEERMFGPSRGIALRRDMTLRGRDKWSKMLLEAANEASAK